MCCQKKRLIDLNRWQRDLIGPAGREKKTLAAIYTAQEGIPQSLDHLRRATKGGIKTVMMTSKSWLARLPSRAITVTSLFVVSDCTPASMMSLILQGDQSSSELLFVTTWHGQLKVLLEAPVMMTDPVQVSDNIMLGEAVSSTCG
jgi:hypothetical protein